MRWSVRLVEVGTGLHVQVEPLDADAAAEDLWATAPSALCSKRPSTGGVCGRCVSLLAGLVTYAEVVNRWQQQNRQIVEQRGGDEDDDEGTAETVRCEDGGVGPGAGAGEPGVRRRQRPAA